MAWYWYLVMGLLGVGLGWWSGGLLARRFVRRRVRPRVIEVEGGVIGVSDPNPLTLKEIADLVSEFERTHLEEPDEIRMNEKTLKMLAAATGIRVPDKGWSTPGSQLFSIPIVINELLRDGVVIPWGRGTYDPEAWLRRFGPMTNEGRDFLAKVAKARIDRDG